MIQLERSSHIDDGALVRLIDGELDGIGMREHLDACPICRRRMDALRETGFRLDDLLGGPVLPREPVFDPEFLAAMEGGARVEESIAWRIPGFGLAAAAMMATLFLLASPAGAWIAARIEAVFSRDAEPTLVEAPSAQLSAPSAPAPVGSRVSAAIGGSRLIVRLSRGEMPQRIVVRRSEGGTATARVDGTGTAAEMMVRPDGFDVLSAGGTLDVEIPQGIERVEVWIGGVVTARWPDAGGAALPWEVITADR